MAFSKIDSNNLSFNPFTSLSKDWALLTAEKNGKANTMTVAWGGFGVLWGKNVVTLYVRPQRYTKEFLDGSNTFSLSFMPESQRKNLVYLGKASGRNEDKISKAGLTVCHQDKTPYFAEAERVFILKKIYVQPLSPEGILDSSVIPSQYAENDFHYIYIGEITDVLEQK